MNHQPPAPEPPRRPTSVSLSEPLVEEAEALGVNLSRACESGLAAAVKAERERRWLEENRAALEEANAYVEEHGLPLAKYRMFRPWPASTLIRTRTEHLACSSTRSPT